jgi:hypothetical protein
MAVRPDGHQPAGRHDASVTVTVLALDPPKAQAREPQ